MITVAFDPTPRPARTFMELWGLDPENKDDRKKVSNWCLTEKVPGAFRGPDGSWWVQPLVLLTWGAEPELLLRVAE